MGSGEMARRIKHGCIACEVRADWRTAAVNSPSRRPRSEVLGSEVIGGRKTRADWFSRKDAMRQPHIDDFVRLTQDIPELLLIRGEVGVVRSTWFAPSIAYEVEFHQIGHDYQTRCLLGAEQVIVEDGPLMAPASADEPRRADYVASV